MSFIRWCGGKGQSIKHIIPKLIEAIEFVDTMDAPKSYIEPFLGSGIVLINILRYFESRHQECTWNFICTDINSYLIDAFNQIKNDVYSLIAELDKYNLDTIMNEESYYELRDLYNYYISDDMHTLESTTLFLILNKICFKGLYQVSKTGKFNTPFGKKQSLKKLYNKNLLLDLSYLFKKYDVQFYATDLLEKELIPNQVNVVYLDPPYKDSFNSYDKNKFNYLTFDGWLYRNIDNGLIVLSNNSHYTPPHESRWNEYCFFDQVECMHPKDHTIRRDEVIYTNY